MPRPRAYWIRLDHGVHDHPKIIALSEAVDVSRITVVGHLTKLWLWCSVYRPNGKTEGLSDRMIAEASGWTGDPTVWRAALINTRLLTKTDPRGRQRRGEHLHGWFHRNAYQQRESVRKTVKPTSNSARKPHESRGKRALRDETSGTSYQNDTRRTDKTPDSSEPSADGRSAQSNGFAFPVVGRGTSEWAPSGDLMSELSKAFPSLDVAGESIKARAWCVTNPDRRKTPRGMPKFLYGWMERAQNAGRRPTGFGGKKSIAERNRENLAGYGEEGPQ